MGQRGGPGGQEAGGGGRGGGGAGVGGGRGGASTGAGPGEPSTFRSWSPIGGTHSRQKKGDACSHNHTFGRSGFLKPSLMRVR